MQYNNVVEGQLLELIKRPAVLMTKDNIPYEFMESGSVNRLKNRRDCKELPFELYSFVISNNVPQDKLSEFASGLFLNYVETSNIYT